MFRSFFTYIVLSFGCVLAFTDGALGGIPRDLQGTVVKLREQWENKKRTTSLQNDIRGIAPQVAELLRQRLASGAQGWPDAGTAWFFHEFFDGETDQKNTLVWRDLLLLKSAREGALVGDYASVAWFYQLLADARYRAPHVYGEALDILETTGESSCGPNRAQSVCELEVGGGALRAVGGAYTGLLLQEAAIERFEQSGADKAHAARLRLNLAIGWWQDGIAGRADRHLSHLNAQLAAGDAKLIPGDRAAYHALLATVCEAKLDFGCAEAQFNAAIGAIEKAKPTGNLLELVYRAGDLLDGLAIKFVAHLDCLDCPQNLLKSVRQYVLHVIGSDHPETPKNAPLALALMRTLPEDTFSKEERERLLTNGRRSLNDVIGDGIGKWLENTQPFERRANYAALIEVLGLSAKMASMPEGDTSVLMNFRAFIEAPSIKVADRYVDQTMSMLVESTYDFGGTRDFLREISNVAFYLRSMGTSPAEHSVLRYLWRFYQDNFVNVPNPIDASGRATLATLLGPAFARLAVLEQNDGRSMDALNCLQEVNEFLRRKLEREWQLGEERAVSAIRALRPTVQSTAATLLEIAPRLKGADARKARSDAFELSQVAGLSDTAAALQLTLRNRRIDASGQRALYEERNRLRDEIDIGAAVAGEYGSFSPIGARHHQAKLEQQLESVQARLAGSGEKLGDDRLSSAGLISSAEIGRYLADGEKLLVVQSGDQASLVFIVDDKGNIKAHISNLDRSELLQAVTEIRAGLVIKKRRYPVFPVARTFQLYRSLFGPVGADLVEARAIVSIVSGPLEALPLSVMPTGDDKVEQIAAGTARTQTVSWLVRSTAVSRAPNISTLVALRKAEAADQRVATFLGVGDPILADVKVASRTTEFSGIVKSKRLANVDWLRKVPSLPETRAELGKLSGEFAEGRSELLVGEGASEKILKSKRLDLFDVIVFATHGAVAGVAFDESEPGLILTPPRRASEEDDGFLTMSEISRLRLDARLVLLSACDTATSDGRPLADGLSGLARAFFIAGAQNLIATHWAIPSRPAVEITTRTMRARKAGQAQQWSEALRQAQLALIERVGPEKFAHPASWGAFQVIGSD